MDKKNKKYGFISIMFLICFTGLILSGLLTFASFQKYMAGFHNIDLAVNYMVIEHVTGAEIQDHASDGLYYTSDELYKLGLKQIRESINSGFYFSFCFGIILMLLCTILVIWGYELGKG